MTVNTRTKKTTRRQHSPEYREEALALAEKVGIREAAGSSGCMTRNSTAGGRRPGRIEIKAILSKVSRRRMRG